MTSEAEKEFEFTSKMSAWRNGVIELGERLDTMLMQLDHLFTEEELAEMPREALEAVAGVLQRMKAIREQYTDMRLFAFGQLLKIVAPQVNVLQEALQKREQEGSLENDTPDLHEALKEAEERFKAAQKACEGRGPMPAIYDPESDPEGAELADAHLALKEVRQEHEKVYGTWRAMGVVAPGDKEGT